MLVRLAQQAQKALFLGRGQASHQRLQCRIDHRRQRALERTALAGELDEALALVGRIDVGGDQTRARHVAHQPADSRRIDGGVVGQLVLRNFGVDNESEQHRVLVQTTADHLQALVDAQRAEPAHLRHEPGDLALELIAHP